MNSKAEKIKTMFGKQLVGKASMKKAICETLAKFPPEITSQVTKNTLFVSSFEDAWGFVLRGDEIGDKHLVFFSEELFDQDSPQIHYTIAHEIGHVVLNHRNSFLEQQTKKEVAKQEKEADSFAKKYLG